MTQYTNVQMYKSQNWTLACVKQLWVCKTPNEALFCAINRMYQGRICTRKRTVRLRMLMARKSGGLTTSNGAIQLSPGIQAFVGRSASYCLPAEHHPINYTTEWWRVVESSSNTAHSNTESGGQATLKESRTKMPTDRKTTGSRALWRQLQPQNPSSAARLPASQDESPVAERLQRRVSAPPSSPPLPITHDDHLVAVHCSRRVRNRRRQREQRPRIRWRPTYCLRR